VWLMTEVLACVRLGPLSPAVDNFGPLKSTKGTKQFHALCLLCFLCLLWHSGRSVESEFDEQWMRHALAAAREAQANGEVPIGTCIVSENKLVALSGNRTRTDCDPTAHAEIVALREAAGKLGNYRLTGVDVYSTIEPCAMCAGALIQARVRRLIYGAPDERAGAVTSRFRICDTDFLNHRIQISAGVLEEECRALMREFFQTRRGRIVD
jgi:tRNA(adenine34) deaminase